MKIADILTEVHKVVLSPPGSREVGATVWAKGKHEPTRILPISALDTFEPADKTARGSASRDSEINVRRLMLAIRRGDQVPPVLVRKTAGGWQVIDGHHRLEAHRRLGLKSIRARVISPGRITTGQPSEKLDELIGYKKDLGTRLTPGQVGHLLMRKGFTRLGGGSFGEVFLPPGKDYVLKLVDASDHAYLDFIRNARRSGNPHFPRIIGSPVRVTSMVNAIRLEPLQQWTKRPGEDREALIWFTWAAQEPDWEERLQAPGMQYHRRIVMDLLERHPDLTRAMDLLRQWKPSVPDSRWDLHPGNIMLRGDVPVIIDPWMPISQGEKAMDNIRAKLR